MKSTTISLDFYTGPTRVTIPLHKTLFSKWFKGGPHFCFILYPRHYYYWRSRNNSHRPRYYPPILRSKLTKAQELMKNQADKTSNWYVIWHWWLGLPELVVLPIIIFKKHMNQKLFKRCYGTFQMLDKVGHSGLQTGIFTFLKNTPSFTHLSTETTQRKYYCFFYSLTSSNFLDNHPY